MKKLAFVMGVMLTITVSAANAEEPVQQKDRSAPDYVRCVRELETGSLVKKRKICRTNAEWRNINRDEGRDATDLVERSRAGYASGQ